MMLKIFIATLVVSQALTGTSGYDDVDREKRELAQGQPQSVDYVGGDGQSTNHKILVRDQEVKVSTSDGITSVIDYQQNMLTMLTTDSPVCVSIQLGDMASRLPSLTEVQTLFSSGQTKTPAPLDRIEIKLAQVQGTTQVRLSPLASELCGGQRPMLFRSIIVGVKPLGSLRVIWPWPLVLRPCPWCSGWPCFYWPWWFYFHRILIIIVPW